MKRREFFISKVNWGNMFVHFACLIYIICSFRNKIKKIIIKMSAMQRDVLKSKLPPLPSKPLGQASRFSSL